MQVGYVDYVDEKLELREDVECMHVGDADCSCILGVDLRCYHDEDEGKFYNELLKSRRM